MGRWGWQALLTAAFLLSAHSVEAERYAVSFDSANIVFAHDDPDGVLPPDWNPLSGFGAGDIAHFTGTWLYESDAVDQDPEPRRGSFLYDDPDLTIRLNAAHLIVEYQLDSIEFYYDAGPCCEWSWYRVTGSRSPSSFPGIETDQIVLHFAWEGIRDPVTPVDVPDPLPGSPWELGSGHSLFIISGTNGQVGAGEVMYRVWKSAGRYDDPVPAPECADALDNDGDLLIDFPTDPGCRHAWFPTESPDCEDGIDNDLDGFKDMDDTQCRMRSDRSEGVNCSDGVDNDADGEVDIEDSGCRNANSPFEETECSDSLDNDSDGRQDWYFGTANGDPDCMEASDNGELEVEGCGLGVELSAVLLLIWAIRRQGGRAVG